MFIQPHIHVQLQIGTLLLLFTITMSNNNYALITL